MNHWGYWSSSYDSKRLRFCDNMNRSRCLLSGKATSGSIIKSSFERGLSSGYIFNVIQISSSNLFSLYIIIYRCKISKPASDSCIESSLKFSFGSSNFWGVFQRSSSSNSKNSSKCLKYFTSKIFFTDSQLFPTNLYILYGYQGIFGAD